MDMNAAYSITVTLAFLAEAAERCGEAAVANGDDEAAARAFRIEEAAEDLRGLMLGAVL
jgi:hypothetical protein